MARSQREDGNESRARRLLEKRVSRRGLLTLSLARGAAIVVGDPPQGAAVPSSERLGPVSCGACGARHDLAAVCPVEARQRALARGFGRAPRQNVLPRQSR